MAPLSPPKPGRPHVGLQTVLDASDQRLAKKVNGVVTEKYLWAGLTQLLAVYDGANTLVARFAYADGPLPVKMTQGGQVYYLGYDQVGSLRPVLGASGAIVHAIAYDSFGNILAETASDLTVPVGFAGGLHDRQTGLVRFGFRDYDPDTGRWMAKDSVGFAAGDTNLYGYCLANPVRFVDSDGVSAEIAVAVGVGLSGEGFLATFATGAVAVGAVLTAPVSVPVAIAAIAGAVVVGVAIGIALDDEVTICPSTETSILAKPRQTGGGGTKATFPTLSFAGESPR